MRGKNKWFIIFIIKGQYLGNNLWSQVIDTILAQDSSAHLESGSHLGYWILRSVFRGQL